MPLKNRLVLSCRACLPMGIIGFLTLISANFALAQSHLAPVHLRVAGRELKLKIPALSDGKETYVPLEVLEAVGATGKLNARKDAALVWTQHSEKPEELAIARPNGKPMLLLSDVAQLVNGRIEQPDAKLSDTPPADTPDAKTEKKNAKNRDKDKAKSKAEDSEANPDAKQTAIGRHGDTVYLLARILEARCEDGRLRVTTSFPVPYHSRTLKKAHPLKGYVDCVGASVQGKTEIIPLAADEKHILRIRAGQNNVETARIVIELAPGTTLKASDSPSNSETQIIAGTEFTPTRTASADTQKPKTTDGEAVPPPVGVYDTAHPAPAPNDADTADTHSPIADTRPADKPKPSRNASTIHGGIRRELPPVVVQSLHFSTQNAQRVRLEIGTSGTVFPYVHYQQNATQLVVDIPNASLKLPDAANGEQAVNHPLVSGLHAEQLPQTPPVTRVTLDMNRVVGFTVDSEASKIAIDLRVPRNATGALADKLIVIDAGHGGTSSGAVGRGADGTHYEKMVTLGIALKLRAELEAHGARVVMTRDRDVDVALYDRPRLANDIRADLFISIHNDSNAHPDSASGTSTYYHMSDSSSRALATCVQQAVSTVTGLPSRGALSDGILYQNGLAVLRVSTMPAVLCEVAYINNSRDRRKLLDADFQQKVAQALCRGIRSYVEGAPIREKTEPTVTPTPETDGPPNETPAPEKTTNDPDDK